MPIASIDSLETSRVSHQVCKVGSVPKEICDLKLQELVVDCLGPKPEVTCTCCTKCCRGLPDPKCVDVATGKEVI
jgi:hypothetical protein